jgi:ribosomal protein S14
MECKITLVIEVKLRGETHRREMEVTGHDRLNAAKIYAVYDLYRENSALQSDAVQWTCDALKIDRATVYRAIRYMIHNHAKPEKRQCQKCGTNYQGVLRDDNFWICAACESIRQREKNRNRNA